MPRNPLREENQPQEKIKGEGVTNLSNRQVVQFIDSEGNVRPIPLRGLSLFFTNVTEEARIELRAHLQSLQQGNVEVRVE